MEKSIVLKYLGITFFVSWFFWGALAILGQNGMVKYGDTIFMLIFVIAGNGPLIAAIIVKKHEKVDYKAFLKRIVKAGVSPVWYAFVFLLPIVTRLIGWGVNYLLTGNLEQFVEEPIYYAFIYLPMMILGGGLEEVGWRGVLTDKIVAKKSIHFATMVTALIWCIWHLPLWFIEGTAQNGSNLLTFLLSVIGLTMMLSVLYVKTKSIFLCILFHAFTNSLFNIKMYSNGVTTFLVCIVIYLIFTYKNGKKQNIMV